MASNFHYILSRRVLKNPASRRGVVPLVKDMHNSIVKYPGFLYAKSFWSNDKYHLYTITKWNSIKEWELWHNSNERTAVLDRHYHMAIEEDHDIVDKFEHPEETYIEDIESNNKSIEEKYTEEFGN